MFVSYKDGRWRRIDAEMNTSTCLLKITKIQKQTQRIKSIERMHARDSVTNSVEFLFEEML